MKKAQDTRPSRPGRLRSRTPVTPDDRYLERSDNVFWTIAPPGILLHNFTLRYYLELDAVGYRLWGYLDGARTVDEVVDRCCEEFAGVQPRETLRRSIRDIVETLLTHGFVVERGSGAAPKQQINRAGRG